MAKEKIVAIELGRRGAEVPLKKLTPEKLGSGSHGGGGAVGKAEAKEQG